jgi:diaminopimelate epimerase
MINDNNPNIYVIGEFSDIFNDSNSQTSPLYNTFLSSFFILHRILAGKDTIFLLKDKVKNTLTQNISLSHCISYYFSLLLPLKTYTMRVIHFYKYQGTGNDFILIDNRLNTFPKEDTKLVAQLCERRFGVGGDGLILLEDDPEHDFSMIYYNSDGNPSSMCGNGGRCIVAFAQKLGVIQKEETTFSAPDGLHKALFKNNLIHLQMQDVSHIEKVKKGLFLNTGSPHYVEVVKNLDSMDVKKKGAEIRYGVPFNIEGVNVNFVEPIDENHFKVRTYERGVEDETYSCGTGATATAIAMHKGGKTKAEYIILETKGGNLEVTFEVKKEFLGLKIKEYTNVWLIGEANFVFEGTITV